MKDEDERDSRLPGQRDSAPASGERLPRRAAEIAASHPKAWAIVEAAKKTWLVIVFAVFVVSAVVVLALFPKVIDRPKIVQTPGPTQTVVEHDTTHNSRVTVIPTPGPTVTTTASPKPSGTRSPSPSPSPRPRPSPNPSPTCRVPIGPVCL